MTSALTPFEFLKKASKIETNDCIEWPFSLTDKGYGQLRYEGKNYRAHRLMLLLYGPEPPTKNHTQAAHIPVVCHNRSCINLKHLYWATPSQNMYDKKKDGTLHITSKLTKDQVRSIRRNLEIGFSRQFIALQYGVSYWTICDIANGRAWRD